MESALCNDKHNQFALAMGAVIAKYISTITQENGLRSSLNFCTLQQCKKST